MIEDQVRELADQVASRHLAPWGFAGSDVEAKEDHDGDAALFVTLHFREGSRVADGRAYSDTLTGLRQALLKHGEVRFPYLMYDYPDDPAPFEDEVQGNTA